MSASTFNRGIPTEPDVKAIEDAVGVPAVGSVVTYETLEKILRIDRGAPRFKTVVSAWRKRLFRDLNILIGAVSGTGLQVLDGHGRATASGGIFKHGLRRIARAGVIAERTETEGLNAEDRRTIDHVRGSAAALRLLAATKAKELPPVK